MHNVGLPRKNIPHVNYHIKFITAIVRNKTIILGQDVATQFVGVKPVPEEALVEGPSIVHKKIAEDVQVVAVVLGAYILQHLVER